MCKMTEIEEIIAQRIKKARENLKITQKQVALALGFKTANAISEIERGNVNISAKDIHTLAEYFNKPILYFFGRDYKDEEITAIIESLTDKEISEIRKMADTFVEMRQMPIMLQKLEHDKSNLSDEEHEQELREFIEHSRALLNDQLEAMGRQMTNALKARDLLEVELKITPEK